MILLSIQEVLVQSFGLVGILASENNFSAFSIVDGAECPRA